MLKKLKDTILSGKFLIINFILGLSYYFNINVVYGAEVLYKDIPYLHDYLIVSDLWAMVAKAVGNWIYGIGSYILDSCYEAYNSLSQLDLIKSTNIQNMLKNIDKLVYAVFFIIFIVAIICKIFKIENPFKVLGNTLVCFVAVLLFSTVLTMGTTLKDATIKDIDSIINNGDYTISETIYAQNTVDVGRSISRKKLIYLKASQMKYFNKAQLISKELINDFPYVGSDGNVAYGELGNGMIVTGIGKEMYYRYNTNFWVVNTTIIVSIVVYILAILKHAFLAVEWFIINVFGKFGLGRGMFAIENIGKVGKSIVDNLVAQIVLFALMSLFSVYCSATMTSDITWIVKCLLIFAFGMTVFVGSDFINKGLGIGDNFGRVAASMFAAGRLSRMAKRNIGRVAHGIGAGAGKVMGGVESASNKAYDKMSEEYQDKIDNAMQSDEFREAMNDGRREYDVDQAKEKINEQTYNQEINDQAKQEIYGDDYKVQEEKEKLMQGDERNQSIDQAKKELYGDDYKIQEEKQKLMQGDERNQSIDQAKKEIYGDDYRVQEEKSKLIQGDEKEQAVHQAKQEVYGSDYKYQEVKEDVIKGEEHGELKDKAMRELHGDDYREKQMKADIETSLVREDMKKQIIGERDMSSSVSTSYTEKSLESDKTSSSGEDEIMSLLDQLMKGEL